MILVSTVVLAIAHLFLLLACYCCCTTSTAQELNQLNNDPPSYFGGVNNQEYLDWITAKQIDTRYTFSTYVPSRVPSNGVAIHWSIAGSEMFLAIAAPSTGWVGFGISEAGGMYGADMAIYAKIRPNEILDAHVVDVLNPITDDCRQDWQYVNSSSTTNFLMFETRRQLDTGDLQDKVLAVSDADPSVPPTRVISAWGDQSDYTFHGLDNVARGAVRFYGTSGQASFDETMNANADSFFMIAANSFTIPAVPTHYEDFCFTKADLTNSKGVPDNALSIIGFRPVVSDGASAPLVHHFVVTGFYDSSSSACSGINHYTMVYVWAPGDEPYMFEDFLGVPLFGSTGFQGFNIEIHYNNPFGQSGIVDSSGVEFYYTSQIRSVEVGVLQLADPFVTLIGSDVGTGLSKHEFGCPGSCSQLFLDEPVTVIREYMHMHQIGTRMTSQQLRNGQVIRSSSIEVWDFDQNGNAPVQQAPFQILPGDSFHTTCYYDSLKSLQFGATVQFGLGSEDEMCISFVYYYPLKTVGNSPWLCGLVSDSSCIGSYSVQKNLATADLERTFGGVCPFEPTSSPSMSPTNQPSISPAPTNQPPPSPPCFSSLTKVIVSGKGPMFIKDIRVGDEVLTASGAFQSVYALDHFHTFKPTKFLQIHTTMTGEEPLELTELHMIFLQDRSHPIPASQLQIGDVLQTMRRKDEPLSHSVTITKIEQVMRNGYYNVLTLDGTIVVNGVIGSTYPALTGTGYIEIFGGRISLMSYQDFVHMALTPIRVTYRIKKTLFFYPSSSPFHVVVEEQRSEAALEEEYYFAWYSQLHNYFFRLLSGCDDVVQTLILGAVSLSLVILSMCFYAPFMIGLASIVVTTVVGFCSKKRKGQHLTTF